MLKYTLAVLLLCSACGDDSNPATNDAGGDGPNHDGSADGGNPNCLQTGWDGLALDGTVWSIDHHVPAQGDFAGIVKFAGSGATLQATYNGSMASTTVQNAGTLSWTRNAVSGTRITKRVFTACTRPSAGEIDGELSACSMTGACTAGTFRMIKLERRAGEGEKSDNITKLGEYQGPSWQSISANVRVDATRQIAVMARYDDGLYLLQLNPPSYQMTELGHAAVEDNGTPSSFEIYNDVKLIDAGGKHYALMASSTHGIVVYDITDPMAPAIKAHMRDGENVHTVFIVGTIAYIADIDFGGIYLYDITNPEAPVEKSSFSYQAPNPPPNPPIDPLSGVFVHDLFVEPGRAYLSYWGAGLVIVDVQDPAAPHQLGEFTYPRMSDHSVWAGTINGKRIALIGDEDFTAHGRELDVTDPAHPTLIGEYGQDRPQVSIHNIMIDGDKAYVAWYMDGLRILQLSDTAAPTLLGYFNTWSPGPNTGYSFYESAIGLDKIGNIVYLADEDRGLIVLQVP